ncbi:MAG: hypothetical protein GY711_09455 [bacterium]|nr:hypothetical protein [bacterium]
MSDSIVPVRAAFALLLVTSCATLEIEQPQQAPADAAWSQRLIDPVSSPVTFETPVVHTTVKPVFIDQSFPDDSIFGGGGFQVLALQLRWAVTDRLGIIATKDGYIDLEPDVGEDEDGFADLGAGVKYAVIDDRESGLIVTPGLIFETTSGDEEVFQGNGDGIVRPFLSAGLDRDRWNFLGSVAYSHPLDDDEEAASYDYHLHVSYEATADFFPLAEVNGITYTGDANALPVDFEGGDLINLGADDVSGNTVVTGAIGARYRVKERFFFGLSYEWPLTSREDLMDERFTFDVVILF